MRTIVNLWLITALLPFTAHAFDLPPNDGFVTDTAGVLSESEDEQLESALQLYKEQTTNEIAVLIVNTADGEPLADIAVEVGREWGVGSKENDNGILILIAYEDRELFIATGYGLEGAVPDIVAKGIIDSDIVPYFREGQYFDGIQSGIDSLQKHIGGEYTADRYAEDDDGPGWAGGLVFFLFFAFQITVAILGRSKSWWLGGVLGGIAGIVLTALYGWWWSIPGLTIIGLIIDFIVSKTGGGGGGHGGRRRSSSFYSGGGRSGGSSGGFGGFSGGSFGGGGAGGRW